MWQYFHSTVPNLIQNSLCKNDVKVDENYTMMKIPDNLEEQITYRKYYIYNYQTCNII